jgi:eukaryotic-like serine/threonine-protein kinase
MEPLDTIFLNAREIDNPTERLAYLEQACGSDAELRARVTAMLQEADAADKYFGSGEIESPQRTEIPETTIDRYQLLKKIGEGGMGILYLAEQREPVVRKVALKIIKEGMDTRQVVARFEAERQALAMMDHPNICKVLDGGVTETKRPYFVMDLVQGLPITQFCDEAKLSTGGRLELFLEVCSAIQHAHQKGIIHRDIKPSNILVTLHGDKPVPKVIDFGIAKATQQPLTDKTLFTQFQHFIGTPAYMSPEQASLT